MKVADKNQSSGKGLEGVVVDSTSISKLLPEKRSLIYRGYPIADLVKEKTYEEVVFLLWTGELPSPEELSQFKSQCDNRLNQEDRQIIEVLRKIPSAHPMDALRTAVSLLGARSSNTWDQNSEDIRKKGLKILNLAPVFISAHNRFKKGLDFISPDSSLSHAENFLYMCFGERPSSQTARAFEESMILYAEHGFNASTFTARVISSTTSDIHSAICGAIGSLKGPLHGGANEQVMYMMKEIKDPSQVESYLSQALKEKKKIMGFGHRVYKHGDARVPSMYNCTQRIAQEKRDTQWLEMYKAIENYMREKKNILPNVDFPAGPAYYMMGLDIELFTPIFAMSRIAGWVAHIIEQKENNRIIRPMSRYTGPEERTLDK